MRPFIFEWGQFSLPAYNFMIMVAVLLATAFAYWVAKKRGLPTVYIIDLAIINIIAGFLGARIAHVLIEPTELITGSKHYYLENPLRFFYFWQGGFVSLGDYVAILFASYGYLRWRKLPVWLYMDILAFAFPVAIFFGRVGCLMAGCCYGQPTDFWLHLTFTHPAALAHYYHPNVPLHATQLYLMLHQVVVWLVLFYVYKKRWRFQGQLLALLLLLYAPGRFLIEFLRGDLDRGVYWGGALSSAQLAMPFAFLTGLLLYRYFKKRGLPVEVKVDDQRSR